jgi:hypothetical protein
MTQPSSSTGKDPAPRPVSDTSRAAGPSGPGVPLSIWPGLPAPGGAPPGLPCGGPVTAAAARQVIESFSRPGDLVAAAGGSPAVTEVASAVGRAAVALLPDGRSGYPLPIPNPVIRLRPGSPALELAPGNPVTGQAALAIADRHGPGCCASPGTSQDDRDGGLLYAACERLLRPGGVLAVIIASPAVGGPLTDLVGGTVPAARAAGLVYAQHIVLVHAAITGDHLEPGEPTAAGSAVPPGGIRAHSDLLVFTKPGGPRP